jgi:hypothetical protein
VIQESINAITDIALSNKKGVRKCLEDFMTLIPDAEQEEGHTDAEAQERA